MTKEEKIKEAYGNHWDFFKEKVNENGWIKDRDFWGVWPEDMNKINWQTTDHENDYYDTRRPLSLKGIENNNGWITINSKLDLPIVRGYYFVIMHGKKTIMGYNPEYQKWIGGGHYYFEPHENLKLTHYQPINFPNDPIY